MIRFFVQIDVPFSRSRVEPRIPLPRSNGIYMLLTLRWANIFSPAHLVYTLESCLILFISGIAVQEQEL